MFQSPVVGDIIFYRVEALYFIGAVGYRGAVGYDGGFSPTPLKAVPYPRRYFYENVVVFTDRQFLNLSVCFRVRPGVVEDQLNHAGHNNIVEGHFFMDMPSLDDAGLDDGKIYLAEFLEMRFIGA
ncbi:MAG: hypothetical protein A2Z70_04155 [Chloroflexi bacterium RBG_13_48_17]|nr:MAG: hypothetical protein A2Z70_04155 [Chloroflexi bacterium RBG_13_48_17]